MSDRRIANLARLIVEYSTRVRDGDQVMIWGHPLEPVAAPLILELYEQVLQAGGNPVVYADIEGLDYVHYQHAKDHQLDYVNPFVRLVLETFDVQITISASSNAYRLSGIPPERIARVRKAYAASVQQMLQRAARGEHRWLATRFPTSSLAQLMGINLPDLEDFFYRCVFADRDDPIGAWQAFSRQQDRIVKWLTGKDLVQLKGPNIELAFSIQGRNVLSDAGEYNLPDGEIETSPVEETVNGWIRFSYPSVEDGHEMAGIELTFQDGRVVGATAAKGDDYLQEMLNTDEGARYVGEFAIGTNEAVDRFTKELLFDEKMAGTIHIALGNGYPESGSKNRSAIHWDLICDMRDRGQILADGELMYEAGRFLI